ncbi:BatA domain-containing protein [Peijinzhouia sedimentorum]
MSFFNSAWLWAATAIAIPIAIHLWNARKGKPMPWATIQFLQEKENQTSRGFQLDHILLLVLRCLILIIIAFLLAEPIQNAIYTDNSISKIHLVAPSQNVVEDFRFELSQAFEQSDEVYWLNSSTEELTSLENLPVSENQKLDLQKHIDAFSDPNVELHFYLENDVNKLSAKNYFIPNQFQLHLSENLGANMGIPAIQFADNALLVSEDELLQTIANSSLPSNAKIIHQGPIFLVFEAVSAQEENLLKTAIGAIEEVCSMEFVFEADRNPDLIFTKSLPEELNEDISYVLINSEELILNKNLFPLEIEENQRFEAGQLPEEILEIIIEHFDIDWRPVKTSQQQFAGFFAPIENADENRKKPEWPILLLLLCVGAERIVALNRNR